MCFMFSKVTEVDTGYWLELEQFQVMLGEPTQGRVGGWCWSLDFSNSFAELYYHL